MAYGVKFANNKNNLQGYQEKDRISQIVLYQGVKGGVFAYGLYLL